MKNKLANMNFASYSLFKLDASVTYKCNSRCKYCNIWKVNENPEEMKLRAYEAIFKKLDLSWLHLTGGEPFLREDFSRIVISASKSMSNLLLIDTSTNGILTEKIVKDVYEILDAITTNFEIGVSIDGTEKIHDRIRGVRGARNSAMKTYSGLTEIAKSQRNFDTHINYVISPDNLGRLADFLDEMRKYGVKSQDISLEVARSSHFFRNNCMQMDKKEVISEIELFLKSCGDSPRNPLNRRYTIRILYLDYMKEYLKTGQRIPCAAGRGSVFMDPHGLVYPCSAMEKPTSAVRKTPDIEHILSSHEMKKWRGKYENCKQCWSGCEGITSILQDAPRTIIKLLKQRR